MNERIFVEKANFGEWSNVWCDPYFENEEALKRIMKEIGRSETALMHEPIPHFKVGPKYVTPLLINGAILVSSILFDKHVEISELLKKDLHKTAEHMYQCAEWSEWSR